MKWRPSNLQMVIDILKDAWDWAMLFIFSMFVVAWFLWRILVAHMNSRRAESKRKEGL